jgi:hypothetical protein
MKPMETDKLSHINYFFCYDSELSRYLKFEKGFSFITSALHPKSIRLFYLYKRDDKLNEAINEYMQME